MCDNPSRTLAQCASVLSQRRHSDLVLDQHAASAFLLSQRHMPASDARHEALRVRRPAL